MRKFFILFLTLFSLFGADAGYAADAGYDGGAVYGELRPGDSNAEALAGTDSESYVIGPQNVIQIKIFGEASVNPTYRVDELGYITHALVGRVKLAGMSVVQAEEAMERLLEGDYIVNPQVTIFILEHSRFSILGEVRRPGTYELTGRVSIIEAISMAGGFTPVANQKDVKILRKTDSGRGGESTVKVDVNRILQRGEFQSEVFIEADDSIIVPKSFF